jgi:hypothetical protein
MTTPKEYAIYNRDEIKCQHPEGQIRVADDNTGAFCRKCCSWISVTDVATSARIAALEAQVEQLAGLLKEGQGIVTEYHTREQELIAALFLVISPLELMEADKMGTPTRILANEALTEARAVLAKYKEAK